jgi:molecular chaperone GrpE
MCQPDRPEDQSTAARIDPAAEDTGQWPLPQVQDGDDAARSDLSESAMVASETEQVEQIDIPRQEFSEPPFVRHAEPSEPPAASTPRIIAAISQLGNLVEHRLAGLQTMFDREIRAEASRERVVDRLHAELQEYKQDLLLKVQRPIFIDLIQLHDDIGKMIEAQPAEDPDRAVAIRSILESIRAAIEDTLYRQGVEPFQNEGEEFDPRRQRSVTTVPTEDPERNKTIAGRLRPGFQAGDKLVRPELVSVHVLKK